ncbi:MAG TPA: hypothetical protein VLH75_05005 [Longimicrobiales bacterium]|nr:hypothetical protein [Longimicrobiales bacterium]
MRPVRSSLLLVAVALAACGGSREADTASMPVDTLIKPMEREPLTEADLAGFTLAELVLELPWTTNQVGRAAAGGAPASSIRGAEVGGHEGFDRVVFLLDDDEPVPGYDIAIAAAGASLPCGEGGYELTAARSLVVSFRPARLAPDDVTGSPAGIRSTGASRMARAGVACDTGDAVVWVAELPQGDQMRVLELRDPSRIAVDVR